MVKKTKIEVDTKEIHFCRHILALTLTLTLTLILTLTLTLTGAHSHSHSQPQVRTTLAFTLTGAHAWKRLAPVESVFAISDLHADVVRPTSYILHLASYILHRTPDVQCTRSQAANMNVLLAMPTSELLNLTCAGRQHERAACDAGATQRRPRDRSYILHLTSYILHLTSCILHQPTPPRDRSYILHLTSYILHLTSYISQVVAGDAATDMPSLERVIVALVAKFKCAHLTS